MPDDGGFMNQAEVSTTGWHKEKEGEKTGRTAGNGLCGSCAGRREGPTTCAGPVERDFSYFV